MFEIENRTSYRCLLHESQTKARRHEGSYKKSRGFMQLHPLHFGLAERAVLRPPLVFLLLESGVHGRLNCTEAGEHARPR